jgi:hypothetical protein
MPYQRPARFVLDQWRAIERRLATIDPSSEEAEANALHDEYRHLICRSVGPPPAAAGTIPRGRRAPAREGQVRTSGRRRSCKDRSTLERGMRSSYTLAGVPFVQPSPLQLRSELRSEVLPQDLAQMQLHLADFVDSRSPCASSVSASVGFSGMRFERTSLKAWLLPPPRQRQHRRPHPATDLQRPWPVARPTPQPGMHRAKRQAAHSWQQVDPLGQLGPARSSLRPCSGLAMGRRGPFAA